MLNLRRRVILFLGLLALGFLSCNKADDKKAKADAAKQKIALSAKSLAAGGVVLFADGTKRKFKKVQGEQNEPQVQGGVIALDVVDYLKFYNYDNELKEREILFHDLSRIKFETFNPEDFKAIVERRLSKGGERGQPVGTYPPFVEFTYLTGKTERLRTERIPIIVTWEDAPVLKRTRFNECWREEQNGMVLMVEAD